MAELEVHRTSLRERAVASDKAWQQVGFQKVRRPELVQTNVYPPVIARTQSLKNVESQAGNSSFDGFVRNFHGLLNIR